MQSKVGGRCLDLGCGTGNNLNFLIDNGFDAYGVDFAMSGLRMLSTPLRKKVTCLHFKALAFLDNSFDFIIDRNSIQHNANEDIRTIYQESFRCLKPKGRMLSLFLTRGLNDFSLAAYSEEALDSLLKEIFPHVEKNYQETSFQNGTVVKRVSIFELSK